MSRRKSTLDAWLDVFAEWNQEERTFALGQVQAIHRAITVSERAQEPAKPPEKPPEKPATRAILAGPTTVFVGEQRIDALSDLTKPERNAALEEEPGPKQ